MPSSVTSILCNANGTINATLLDKFNDTEGVSMDSMLNVINKGGIGYRVRNIAGLAYLPEFIATTQIGNTSRLLGLFIERYIRLCYNHVMKRDK